MLHKAAVKIGFKEPKKRLFKMFKFLENFGTSEIHLVHVTTKSSMRHHEDARARLEEISLDVAKLGFTVKTHVRQGHLPTEFIDVAEAEGVDYLALYWIPFPMLRNALLGNMDSDILRLSCLPVFIYDPKLFKPAIELDSVLYATDFKHTDAVVLPYLVDSRFKARKLYLQHVGSRAPDPVTEERRRQHIVTNLQRLAHECAHAYDEIEIIETIGVARRQIVKQANANNVELIVIGKSGNLDAVSQFIGSTAENLPNKAKRNVFIIPGVCTLPSSAHGELSGSRTK
ncbi:MAG: universal stress protein [Desulfovibrionales bacterium]